MATSIAPASKDTPRTLRHKKTGEQVRCVDPGEYLTLTSAMGYRDITDADKADDQAPSQSTAAPTSSATPAPSSDVPPQSATKDVWVEHAVARGADRATAEGTSKADLIAAYGA